MYAETVPNSKCLSKGPRVLGCQGSSEDLALDDPILLPLGPLDPRTLASLKYLSKEILHRLPGSAVRLLVIGSTF